MSFFARFSLSVVALLSLGAIANAAQRVIEAPTPAVFLPSGILGIQLGDSSDSIKKHSNLQQLDCQATQAEVVPLFDEVCFFQIPAASRLAGAPIHDGILVSKNHHVVLVATGITIKNAEDPLADAVIANLQSSIQARYQVHGSNVLFIDRPPQKMTDAENEDYARRVPVMLVQLEAEHTELSVMYGYLAQANAFQALFAN